MKFFSTTAEKVYTLLFSILVPIINSFAVSKYDDKIYNVIFWFIYGIMIAVYIVIIILCNYFQKQAKKEKEARASELNEKYIDIGRFLSDYISSNIYNVKALDVSKKNLKLLPEKDNDSCAAWVEFNKIGRFRSQWDTVCRDLCNLVKTLSEKGSRFGVNIIIRTIKNNEKCYYMPSHAYTFQPSSKSSLQDNVIPATKISSDRYYKKLFEENIKREQILPNNTEINKSFSYDGKPENSRNQYIALPIRYYDHLVGIVQIVAYKDSLICEGKDAGEKLRDIVDNYFRIYEKFITLSFILGLQEDVN